MRRCLISSSSSSSSPLFSLHISHLASTTRPLHTHTSSPCSSSSHSSRRDEENRNVRVSVWWDFENCNLPATIKPFKVAGTITAAVRASGIKGPIQITGFGDVFQLSRSNQEALSSTGVNLTHVPCGGKNSADRSLLADLMYWVSQNPPPAHIFLISGDRDFAIILHRLRMNNYNILLASPKIAPGVLCSAASIMWPWYDMLMGEKLTGRYFNQPPDGPYGSWYGHYKVPLEDPFSVNDQSAVSRAENKSEPGSDSKVQMINAGSESTYGIVLKQIRHILKSHPKGIRISTLPALLEKCNVTLEKSFYGHKKCSSFLASLPHMFRLEQVNDGYMVYNVTSKSGESFQMDVEDKSTSDTMSRKLSLPVDGKSPFPVSLENIKPLKGSELSCINRSSPLPPFPGNVKPLEKPQKLSSIDKKSSSSNSPDNMKPLAPDDEKVVEVANLEESQPFVPPVVGEVSVSDVGYFERFRRKWFGSGLDNFEMGTYKEKTCPDQLVDPVPPASSSSIQNESDLDSKAATISELNTGKSHPGIFKLILNRCKFWKSSPSDQSCDGAKLMESHTEEHILFSEDSFWVDVESFLDTPEGSVVISESRTREEMALNLQNKGPLACRSLAKGDLLQLVDMLIQEKKLVEECPNQQPPFRLAQHNAVSLAQPDGGPSMNQSSRLSSIFSGKPSKHDMQRSTEHDGETKCKNIPSTGVSLPLIRNHLSDKSRTEILADCQKLVNETLKEFPNGYNLGLFRRAFRDRFDYHLDLHMLGYEKLAPLFQILEGVKVDGAHMFPFDSPVMSATGTVPDIHKHSASHAVVNSGKSNFDSRKNNDSESPWAELGPISDSEFKNNEVEVAPRKQMGSTDFELFSDFSDSDGEALAVPASNEHGNGRVNIEDSSLLQILDSFHSNKTNSEHSHKNNSEMVESRTLSKSKPSASSRVGTNLGNHLRKSSSVKSYSFLAETNIDEKDVLIDGILGIIKKSSEPRLES